MDDDHLSSLSFQWPRVELDPPGIMRAMSPLIKRMIGKGNGGFLANLKRLLEGSEA
jgi:hypothetical protein